MDADGTRFDDRGQVSDGAAALVAGTSAVGRAGGGARHGAAARRAP